MKKCFLLCIPALLLLSCNTIKNPGKAIEKMKFLEGTWQYEDQGVVVTEIWKYHPDSLTATSVLSVKGDTLFIENIAVKNFDGTVNYKSTTGKYIKEDLRTLPLTRVKKNVAVFGYRNHLNSIYIYYRMQKGKMVLEMRDIIDNKVEQDRYTLKKVN